MTTGAIDQTAIAPNTDALDTSGNAQVASGTAVDPVVIIGGGPAGIRVAQELARCGNNCVLFNAERWLPYNRVKLTPLLCGDAQVGQVMQPLTFPGPGEVTLHSSQSIVDVDRDQHTVTTSAGHIQSYRKLIFATGSRAHVPPFPGVDLPGVYTFRNFDDVEKLVARTFRSRRTIVIGGGLLGLEAARGMANRGVETWIIEHETHLMSRQIDPRAGALLAEKIEALGLHVRTGVAVRGIVGEDRVERIELSNGDVIPCDTVIICTGIRANRELAREVGLAVGRGITVSATMQTSDPDIYAIGECAEHNEQVCGLVGPAFEQASIAARHIAGEDIGYAGSFTSTKLKIVGIDIFSMGDTEQLAQRSDVDTLTYEADGAYRRIVLQRNRVVGAISVGDWDEINHLQELIRAKAPLPFWQRIRFARTGRIRGKGQDDSVRNWPRAATVCNCTGVNCGQIGDAIALGAATIEDIRRETGASTVCGSCHIHIAELLDAPPVRKPAEAASALTILAGLALLAGLITLMAPVWPLAGNVLARGLPEHLWLDGFWKQTSGYVLLGLSAIAAVLSLRKRVKWLRLGDFSIWRVIHLAVGAVAILVLFVHTGFRLGHNLNFWLIATFLGLSLAGAAAGMTTALEHRLFDTPKTAARTRSLSFWLHLLMFWPIPVLLAVHILTVYYY